MIKPTPAGERRDYITIRQPAQGTNDWKQPVDTWSVFATLWAKRISHSGREFYQAQQRQSEIAEVFNVRYTLGITAHMKIVFGGQVYDIIDVDDLEGRHIEMNLYCQAAV